MPHVETSVKLRCIIKLRILHKTWFTFASIVYIKHLHNHDCNGNLNIVNFLPFQTTNIYNLKNWVSFACPVISLFLGIAFLDFLVSFSLLSKLFWHFTAVFGFLWYICCGVSFSLVTMTFSLVLSTSFLFGFFFSGWQFNFSISFLVLPFWQTLPEPVPSVIFSSDEVRFSDG